MTNASTRPASRCTEAAVGVIAQLYRLEKNSFDALIQSKFLLRLHLRKNPSHSTKALPFCEC